MLIVRAARLPVDGYQLLCKMVHDFRSVIVGTIIIGFVVGIGSGLVLLRPSDLPQTMLAQALGHPAYMVSAVAVVVVLITMDQRGARQMIVAGVAQPARAVVPIETFNMPQDAHPVGRQALLNAIERRLCAGLSTNVYGIPGVGKSCLAAAVVSRLLGPDKRRGRRLFPGGVAWITCERLEAGEAGLAQLVASVSIALEIKLIGSGGPAEQLARALQARRCSLLVLDGLEVGEGGLREVDMLRALRQNNWPRASAKSSDDEGEKTKI